MDVFGFAGYSGSGKTTLLERLIPRIVARGLSVSVVKHAHHAFDIDRPGKDSFRHREAGATEVLIASGHRWALMHELRDEAEPAFDTLVARMSPVDLLLIEGYKFHPLPKLEVHRPSLGKPLLHPTDPHVVGVASDEAIVAPVPVLALDDIDAIVGFVLAHRQRVR